MAKQTSSGRWKQRQARDPYVRKAHAEGWRSRAAFKLQEILARERCLRRGAVVVDLGAAPGGWSQVAAAAVGEGGLVVAVDLLEFEPIPGVRFIRGDFCDESVIAALRSALGGRPVDLVLSDMAPNISGNWSVDQPRSMALAEQALEAAEELLKPAGGFIVKVFQGEGFAELVRTCRGHFATVRIRKPDASRAESREMYVVATGRRLV
ncbi:MAG: 23S rRNA methyltransferase [Gammaproteobacteria bacterium]|nr:23S rRNA methyltransferase [Gammaproteobacteria bacterium]